MQLEPRIDLQSHLLRCARTEPELHVLKEYYRDHFFHCLEVSFLGHLLLDLYIDGDPLWMKIASILGISGRKEVLRLWYLTALLHDIGYMIDALKATNNSLQFFGNSREVENLRISVQKGLESFSHEIGDINFCEYTADDKPGEDHGVVSAIHLFRLLEKISTQVDNFKWEKYESAIRAIADHNNRKHVVAFKDRPLSFLLILCDTLQEWVRPRLIYSMAPIQMLSWLINGDRNTTSFNSPFRSLRIENLENFRGNYAISENYIHFVLDYDDGISLNSAVFNLWIDATCNLQRLRMDGLEDLKIDIEYITPFYQQQFSSTPQMQLHRLRHAVDDTHMGFLRNWFPEKRSSNGNGLTNNAVSYYTTDPKKEHLILHLNRICGSQLITKDISEFRTKLKKWKHYNDDRVFAGDYAPEDSPS